MNEQQIKPSNKPFKQGARMIEEVSQEQSNLLIPKKNPAYKFPKVTKNVSTDITENKKVLLIGHTGCGKTSLFEQLAAQEKNPVIRTNMNGQSTVGDFVGLWTVKNGETIWVDGVLPFAMRYGFWLIIDELDFAEASILSVLNAVLEPNGKLMLKEKGHEVVIPHENFRMLATANAIGANSDFRSLYQGTNIMNEAFLDRWRCYQMSYLDPKDEAEVLVNTIKDLTEEAAEELVTLAGEIRQAFNNDEITCTFSLRRLIDFGELLCRFREEETESELETLNAAADIAIYSKISKADADVIKQLFQHKYAK
jgi:cobaltochelatase CobS